MGTMYAILSVAGWAFFIGLLGYVTVMSRSRPDRRRGFYVLVMEDEPKED